MVKKKVSIGDYYKNLRSKGYSQAKSMERVIMFSKKTPSTRVKVIKKMLTAEKKLKKKKK